MNDVLLIVLGWALGILSPAIIEGIRQRREGRRVQRALAVELQQFQYRLTLASFYVRSGLGRVDSPYLEWIQRQISAYKGPIAKKSIATHIDTLVSESPERRDELLAKHKVSEGRSVRLTTYAVPLLDSRVSSLWIFDGPLQTALLELRTNIDMLNAEADEATYYFRLSFDERTPEQHVIVNSSIDEACVRWTNRAELIVNKLEEVAPLLNRT